MAIQIYLGEDPDDVSGKVTINPDFMYRDSIEQLDLLSDWIHDLQLHYESILNNRGVFGGINGHP